MRDTFPAVQDEMGHDIAWVRVNELGCRDFELSTADTDTASAESDTIVPVSHAVHCPVCLAKDDGVTVPADSNHWRAGVVVLLEVAGHLLLTQRAAHMRSFPSVWVAPGGHIDNGELAAQAAVRELHEEVGVLVQQEQLRPLAAWGSAFPVRYDADTPPKRQHFVLYFHAKLPGAAVLPELKLQASEVGAHAWVTPEQVHAMLESETRQRQGKPPQAGATDAGVACFPVGGGDAVVRSPADVVAHMAHGHVFALQQWSQAHSS